MRCDPRTAVSAFRMASCVAPWRARISCAGSRFSCVAREQQVLGRDVLVLEVVGFFECALQKLVRRGRQRGLRRRRPKLWADARSLRRFRSSTACGPMPIFSSTGGTMPSRSSSSAASKCSGSNSGLPCSDASSFARCTASCALTVNLSQRIAICVLRASALSN